MTNIRCLCCGQTVPDSSMTLEHIVAVRRIGGRKVCVLRELRLYNRSVEELADYLYGRGRGPLAKHKIITNLINGLRKDLEGTPYEIPVLSKTKGQKYELRSCLTRRT